MPKRRDPSLRGWAISLILALLFVLFMAGLALAADERQIRRDCTWDALRYCKAAIPQGRQFIIVCMIANRDKLQAKCSKHFY